MTRADDISVERTAKALFKAERKRGEVWDALSEVNGSEREFAVFISEREREEYRMRARQKLGAKH